jgi:NAD(P)-dependent dehydrogenase (short-subunit alcohol dehydrogenase family)
VSCARPRGRGHRDELLADRGGRCLAIEADITDRGQIATMMDAIEKEFGRLDILVNNAANFNECPLFETTEAIWESSMGVNLKGPFFVSQAAARLMLKHKSGRIISMGGNSFYENWPGFIAHAIAKSALVKMTQLLAVALSPDIQCNAICPASIYDSEAGSHIQAARGEDVKEGNRLRIGDVIIHKGNPEEVAELIVYLAGCSNYMTGAVIPIDGGKSAL